jgi:hypothetical protein
MSSFFYLIYPPDCLEATSLQKYQTPGQHARFKCKHDFLTSPARLVLAPGSYLEYSVLAIVLHSLGVPSKKKFDGSDVCTVPAFSDPNTGTLIDESSRKYITQCPSPAWFGDAHSYTRHCTSRRGTHMPSLHRERRVFPPDFLKEITTSLGRIFARGSGRRWRFGMSRVGLQKGSGVT